MFYNGALLVSASILMKIMTQLVQINANCAHAILFNLIFVVFPAIVPMKSMKLFTKQTKRGCQLGYLLAINTAHCLKTQMFNLPQ